MFRSVNIDIDEPITQSRQHQDDMEVSYLNKMYPPICREIQQFITSELDEYDHYLSPIYEMYPSDETIDYLANSIISNIESNMPSLIAEFQGENTRVAMGGAFYTLVYALLINELYRKRKKHCSSKCNHSKYLRYY